VRTRLSVVIPVYNEEKNIYRVINSIKKLALPGVDKEIIVVDDGSWDGTSAILTKYHGDPEIQVHFSRLNLGKGIAIRIGLSYATGDIILIQDADLEYDINEYLKLIKPIIDDKADVVYGSRFKGTIRKMHPFNYIGNKILSWLASVLFIRHITDEATAYKVFRASAIKNIKLSCKRFEFCPEVTAKLLRKRSIRYVEVPINYHGRTAAEGKKIGLVDGIIAIWTLIKYRFFK
jgi:glycosyltransferase involved in cell wall biosynthesis